MPPPSFECRGTSCMDDDYIKRRRYLVFDNEGIVGGPIPLFSGPHHPWQPFAIHNLDNSSCTADSVCSSSHDMPTAMELRGEDLRPCGHHCSLVPAHLNSSPYGCGILGSKSQHAVKKVSMYYSFKCGPGERLLKASADGCGARGGAASLSMSKLSDSHCIGSDEKRDCIKARFDFGVTQLERSLTSGALTRPQIEGRRQHGFSTTNVYYRLVNESEEVPTSEISKWFESTHEALPEGAIAIQSSCSYTSPLPALLYGRGVWPATDLLFFSSDLPLTSQPEVEGSSFRIDVVDMFTTSSSTTPNTDTGSVSPVKLANSPARSMLNLAALGESPGRMFTRVRSLTKFEPIAELNKLEAEHSAKIGPQYGFDLKKIGAHYTHRRGIRSRFDIFSKGAMFPLTATDREGVCLDRVFAFCRADLENSGFVIGAINFSDKIISDIHISSRFLHKHYRSQGIQPHSILEVWDMFAIDNTFESEKSLSVETIHSGDFLSTCGRDLSLRTVAETLAEPLTMSLGAYKSGCIGIKLLKGSSIETNPDTVLALCVSSLSHLQSLVARAAENPVIPATIRAALDANYIGSSLVAAIRKEDDIKTLAETLETIATAAQWRETVSAKLSEEAASTLLERFSLFQLLVHGQYIKPQDEDLAVRLFAKLNRIQEKQVETKNYSVFDICKECMEANSIGPIVFMTAELSPWSAVGGLGVMIDDLSTTMVSHLGQEVWVISPYYDCNRDGQKDYLGSDGIQWVFNVDIIVGPQKVTLGVHSGYVKGVRLFFLHNLDFFPFPYPPNTAAQGVKMLSVIGKSFLEVLCKVGQIPQVVVTNDWTTGLIPAYAKHGAFGTAFASTTFFHIIHNFDPTYEGRIFPPNRETYNWVHGLPNNLLVDPLWTRVIINPSRCAILCVDNWGTVSRSYCDDVRGFHGGSIASPLSPLLNRFQSPFATPNGIPILRRLERLKALSVKDHTEAKGLIQKKYFAFETPDLNIPVFAFIGRITCQKGAKVASSQLFVGVHLILEASESIVKWYNHRVQILIGGKVDWADPYSARCGNHMKSLKARYPWSFYADPNAFFTDGTLVNLGADFGLMPSLFEPGGIVQHEFFLAGTPVIAFKTGGLKDTVHEFDLETQTGNGFTFASYTLGDFVFALERAQRVYLDPAKIARLRNNCRESVVSCEESATAWLGEFCRLRKRIPVNPAKV